MSTIERHIGIGYGIKRTDLKNDDLKKLDNDLRGRHNDERVVKGGPVRVGIPEKMPRLAVIDNPFKKSSIHRDDIEDYPIKNDVRQLDLKNSAKSAHSTQTQVKSAELKVNAGNMSNSPKAIDPKVAKALDDTLQEVALGSNVGSIAEDLGWIDKAADKVIDIGKGLEKAAPKLGNMAEGIIRGIDKELGKLANNARKAIRDGVKAAGELTEGVGGLTKGAGDLVGKAAIPIGVVSDVRSLQTNNSSFKDAMTGISMAGNAFGPIGNAITTTISIAGEEYYDSASDAVKKDLDEGMGTVNVDHMEYRGYYIGSGSVKVPNKAVDNRLTDTREGQKNNSRENYTIKQDMELPDNKVKPGGNAKQDEKVNKKKDDDDRPDNVIKREEKKERKKDDDDKPDNKIKREDKPSSTQRDDDRPDNKIKKDNKPDDKVKKEEKPSGTQRDDDRPDNKIKKDNKSDDKVKKENKPDDKVKKEEKPSSSQKNDDRPDNKIKKENKVQKEDKPSNTGKGNKPNSNRGRLADY